MTEPTINTIKVEMVSRIPVRHLIAPQIRQLGYVSWRAQLPHRTPAEIEAVYPPQEFEEYYHHLMEDLSAADRGRKMRQYGRGVLAIATSPDLGTGLGHGILGYALVRNNVSGTAWQRAIKTYAQRRSPYVWVQSINVDPKVQRHGIGSALLTAVAAEFPGSAPSTAYVYDENPGARAFFGRLGYETTDTAPLTLENRFGEATAPAEQWRLQAPTIESVAARGAQIILDKGLSMEPPERYLRQNRS